MLVRTEYEEVDRTSVASQFGRCLAVLGVADNLTQLGDPLERVRHFVVDIAEHASRVATGRVIRRHTFLMIAARPAITQNV